MCCAACLRFSPLRAEDVRAVNPQSVVPAAAGSWLATMASSSSVRLGSVWRWSIHHEAGVTPRAAVVRRTMQSTGEQVADAGAVLLARLEQTVADGACPLDGLLAALEGRHPRPGFPRLHLRDFLRFALGTAGGTVATVGVAALGPPAAGAIALGQPGGEPGSLGGLFVGQVPDDPVSAAVPDLPGGLDGHVGTPSIAEGSRLGPRRCHSSLTAWRRAACRRRSTSPATKVAHSSSSTGRTGRTRASCMDPQGSTPVHSRRRDSMSRNARCQSTAAVAGELSA